MICRRMWVLEENWVQRAAFLIEGAQKKSVGEVAPACRRDEREVEPDLEERQHQLRYDIGRPCHRSPTRKEAESQTFNQVNYERMMIPRV